MVGSFFLSWKPDKEGTDLPQKHFWERQVGYAYACCYLAHLQCSVVVVSQNRCKNNAIHWSCCQLTCAAMQELMQSTMENYLLSAVVEKRGVLPTNALIIAREKNQWSETVRKDFAINHAVHTVTRFASKRQKDIPVLGGYSTFGLLETLRLYRYHRSFYRFLPTRSRFSLPFDFVASLETRKEVICQR